MTNSRIPSSPQIEEDAYQEDLGFSLGHLGKSGSGRVRQTQVNEATKARISKTLQVQPGPCGWGEVDQGGTAQSQRDLPSPAQRTLQKQSVVYGGKSTIRDRSSGTASSVAFTPLQVHTGSPTGVRRAPSPPQASVAVPAHVGGGIVRSQVVSPAA